MGDGRERFLRWLGAVGVSGLLPAFLVLGAWLAFVPAPAAAATPPPFVPFTSVCDGPGDASTSAAVVVDLGDGDVRRACVRLDAPTITGLEALQRGGMTPVTRGFSGMGVAVCALCGTGCGSGNDCLTCRAPKYWGYFRAEPGAGEFTYSQVGAGATAVRPGGVEIWRWGTQAASSTPTDPPTSTPPAAAAPPAAAPPAAPGAPASATGTPLPTAGAGAPVSGATPTPAPSAAEPASAVASSPDAASVAGTDVAAATAEPGTAADGTEGAETLASTALGARVDTRARRAAPGTPTTVLVAGVLVALGAAAAATTLLRRRRRAAAVAADAIATPSPGGPPAGPSR